MKSVWNSVLSFTFTWVVMPVALTFKDWEYFFPLSSHADLRFQAIGEGVEGIVVVGILLFISVATKKLSPDSWPSTAKSRFVIGFTVVGFMFAMFWRDFFPGDHFSLSAGAMDFVYGPIMGVAAGLFARPSKAIKPKPPGVEEPAI